VCCQDIRAQSTAGAIYGTNLSRTQPTHNAISQERRLCQRTPHAQKSDESFDSAIQITMVWTSNKWRRNRSAAGVRAHLEHQYYTFCQALFGLLNASFWGSPGQVPGHLRAYSGPSGPDLHFELGGPPPRFADVYSNICRYNNSI